MNLVSFVDRINEVDNFCRMLGNASKPIMLVWGESEIGKTHLMRKLMHVCETRKLVKVFFEWTGFRGYDYVEIMREIRDNLGRKHFPKFNRLDNSKKSDPAAIIEMVDKGRSTVGAGANISGTVGRMANTIIERQTVILGDQLGAELTRMKKSRMVRLTDAFIVELAKATKRNPIIVFFDPLEKIDPETQLWMWGELFKAVAEGRLPNVKFVACGQPQPQFASSYLDAVETPELKPFAREDIIEYLKIRFRLAEVAVADENFEVMAISILSSPYDTACYPGKVFETAFKLIELYRQRSTQNDG